MRRRRQLSGLLPVVVLLGAAASGRDAAAQAAPPPPVDQPAPPADRPEPIPASPSFPGERPLPPPPSPLPSGDEAHRPPPPAPPTIPGPASAGFPVGGMDATTPRGLPINLATAMQLAGVRPVDIAAATAQVEQSLALLLQAKVLWIPNINGGVDYVRHDGYQQNIFTGALFVKGRQTFFTGGGPTLSVGMADAIFAPLAARRSVNARRADLQAARNDVLFGVTQAFFDLQAARGRLLGTGAAVARAEMLVNFARGLAPSLIPPLEINRARTELQSLRQNQQVAIRDWQVASARLAEVLLLEPTTLLEPIEPPFLQVKLVPCGGTPGELTVVALNNRPEVASRRELVAVAVQLLRQEKSRPLLPTMYVLSPATPTGVQGAGNIAGGANQLLNANNTHFDIELAAAWQLQNAGIGNIGRIRQRRAERDLASVEMTRTIYRVKSEVAQALARLETARVRVVETEEEVHQSVESADKNFIGLRETARPAGELLRLIVRPQEVVQAIEAMNVAYQQYSGAIGEYNVAQFELYHALGQPAQWITSQVQPPPNPTAAAAAPPAAPAASPPPPAPAPAPGTAAAPGRRVPPR